MASEHEMRRVADEAIQVDAEQLRVWADEVAALRTQLAESERLRGILADALGFYACPGSWQPGEGNAIDDEGKIARAVADASSALETTDEAS